MDDARTRSGEPFEAVAFLAGSPNRVAVLDALVTDGPAERDALVEAVGASRVTVARVLDALVDRGWAAREGRAYRVTPVGAVVAAEFESFLDTLSAMERLSLVYPWLPDDFDVDLRRLRDARVTVPTWSDSVAPVRRAAALCRGLDALRVCASGVASDVIEGIRDAAVRDGARVEVVLTTAALDVVRSDPTMRGWIADLLDADGRLHAHPGHPYLVATCDRTAIVGMNDDAGAPRGLVESTDAALRDWVTARIDRCRAEATPVDPATFAE
jgi:predicted transcriptional regulator